MITAKRKKGWVSRAGRSLYPSSCSLKLVCCALTQDSAKRRRPSYPFSCSGNLATGCRGTKWLERSWGGDGSFGCPLSSQWCPTEILGCGAGRASPSLCSHRESLDKLWRARASQAPPVPPEGVAGEQRGACESLVNLHSLCLLPQCSIWHRDKG